jgi:hypothetical protein
MRQICDCSGRDGGQKFIDSVSRCGGVKRASTRLGISPPRRREAYCPVDREYRSRDYLATSCVPRIEPASRDPGPLEPPGRHCVASVTFQS